MKMMQYQSGIGDGDPDGRPRGNQIPRTLPLTVEPEQMLKMGVGKEVSRYFIKLSVHEQIKQREEKQQKESKNTNGTKICM